MSEPESSPASTKTSFVAQSIIKSIKERQLAPGECLRSVRGLAGHFNVSLSVIQAALRQLEKAGVVARVTNSVVVRDRVKAVRDCDRVLLCLPFRGHLFGEFYSHLINGLLDRKLHPILLDPPYAETGERLAEWDRRLKELVLGGVHSILLDGGGYWRHPFLEAYPELRSVFLFTLDFPGSMPERAVLFDLDAATYLAATHLIRTGRRRILMVSYKTEPEAVDMESMSRHNSVQLRCGYERALREHGLAGHGYYHFRSDGGQERLGDAVMDAWFRGAEKPDAVLCDFDYAAMQVEMSALGRGIRVPGDLAVMGIFDTPWSRQAPVPISSVSFDIARLAELAAALASACGRPDAPTHYLRPTLVPRASTAPREDAAARRAAPAAAEEHDAACRAR